MLQLSLGLIKKGLGQKMLILQDNLEFLMAREIFSLKRTILDQWVQKMAIFVLINARAYRNIFRAKKITYLFK